MKKLLSILAIVLLLVFLPSCGSKSDTNENPKLSSNSTSDLDGSVKSESSLTDAEGKLLAYTYKVPGKSIYIDVPDYQVIEKGYTELYILNGERYIAFTYDLDSTAKSAEEANDLAYSIFENNIQNYSYVNKLKVSTSSTETINGIEVYKFSGTLECALDYSDRSKSYDAFAVGYSFVMDGVPCSIIGSVINQNQSSNDIDEITEIVNAMVKSLRNTE